MKALPALDTERLLLRPFAVADAPTVEQLAGAWEVAHTTLNIPHPYPAGAANAWIEGHAAAWEAGQSLTLAICVRDAPDEPAGAIGLSFVTAHARAELGYWVGAPMWGRGYATEAARALIGFGFATLGLNRIQARHFVRNPSSGRVMEKLGMQLEGVHRQLYRRWGLFEDVAMYAVLASEWASLESRR